MRIICAFALLLVLIISANCQSSSTVDHAKIEENLEELINDFAWSYVYLEEKGVDLECIKETYKAKIADLTNKYEVVEFFEMVIYEFYDSHVIFNTRTSSSYRLFAPIYTVLKDEKFIVRHVWSDQYSPFDENLIGAEILSFNGMTMEKQISDFPTQCHNKMLPEVRQWLANKVLFGRYDQARILNVKLINGKEIKVDLDELVSQSQDGLLAARQSENIAYIRFHNSLGNNNTIAAFDKALDSLMDTDGMIIDLRNTVDGGNTLVIRGIMSRFISDERPYQRHSYIENYGGHPPIERLWTEYVPSRGITYDKPVVVLVGRWTGSIGEAMAIGFDGMERGELVGTEMQRLAGSMETFTLKHRNYGPRISTQKLSHINGTPREMFIPEHYVEIKDNQVDEILEQGMELLKLRIKN